MTSRPAGDSEDFLGLSGNVHVSGFSKQGIRSVIGVYTHVFAIYKKRLYACTLQGLGLRARLGIFGFCRNRGTQGD